MTIDIEHNGTHILNESDVRRLIDEREELAAALDAIHAHCVAGSADPRPGVARSSVIRIGEICEEHDYAPRLFARLAAERKAGAVEALKKDGPLRTELNKRFRDIVFGPSLYEKGMNAGFVMCTTACYDVAAQIESGEVKP